MPYHLLLAGSKSNSPPSNSSHVRTLYINHASNKLSRGLRFIIAGNIALGSQGNGSEIAAGFRVYTM